MKLICFSFSGAGEILGKKLESIKEYKIRHIANGSIEGGVKSILARTWKDYDGIIFIGATGIAVRFIAPYIRDKTEDPAVVVIDDLGRFTISLLSGHLGGANDLANFLVGKIGGVPVITTASDNRGFQALDLFAKENNYFMEDMKAITKISSLMVDGKKIAVYTEDNKIPDYPKLEIIRDLDFLKELDNKISGKDQDHIGDIDGLIVISSSKIGEGIGEILDREAIPYAVLRPQNINIGIGCRRGVEGQRIIRAIREACHSLSISTRSIRAMATVEVKKDEAGIIEAARYFNCPLNIFTIGDIGPIEERFEKSQFVKDTIGVYSVSEPCAYLLGGEFILKKGRYNGITISITRESANG